LRGDIEEVLADPNIWKCLECYTCLELCHSDIGMAETFRTLKELSIKRGTGPESVPAAYKMFMDTGMLGKPKEGARKKLGLGPLPESGGDAMRRLMGRDAVDVVCEEEGEV
jgi:heterodisulfide reductase subunit C